MPEIWDLYDINRQPVGQTAVRGSVIPAGLNHIVVHIAIFNSQGQMLIQRRQPFKEGWPGMWDISAGGSAVAGEDSARAAARELSEEIGLRYDFTGIQPNLTVNFGHGFDDYYLIALEPNLADLWLQEEEVAEVRWASLGEVIEMIDNGTFIPYYRELIGLLFASRFHYGAHSPE